MKKTITIDGLNNDTEYFNFVRPIRGNKIGSVKSTSSRTLSPLKVTFSDNNLSFGTNFYNNSIYNNGTLQYSLDKNTWIPISSITTSLGQNYCYLKGDLLACRYLFSNISTLKSVEGRISFLLGNYNSTDTSQMFNSTFFGCSSLISIPSGLFDSIDTSSSTNTTSMFQGTFNSCSSLTTIPTGLFDSIDTSSSTNTSYMFSNTFYNCSSLIESPLFSQNYTTLGNGNKLWNRYGNGSTNYIGNGCFIGCTIMSDLSDAKTNSWAV